MAIQPVMSFAIGRIWAQRRGVHSGAGQNRAGLMMAVANGPVGAVLANTSISQSLAARPRIVDGGKDAAVGAAFGSSVIPPDHGAALFRLRLALDEVQAATKALQDAEGSTRDLAEEARETAEGLLEIADSLDVESGVRPPPPAQSASPPAKGSRAADTSSGDSSASKP